MARTRPATRLVERGPTYAVTLAQVGPELSKVKPDLASEVTQNCIVAPVIPV